MAAGASGELAGDRRLGDLVALLVLPVLGAVGWTMAPRREQAPATTAT